MPSNTQGSKLLIYVLVGLLLFAVGYIGFNIYLQQHREATQALPPPAIPKS